MGRRQQRAKKKKWWPWLLLGVLIIIGSVIGKLYLDITSTIDSVHHETTVQSIRTKKVDLDSGEPLNILLIGTDADKNERDESAGYVSRSDTLMLVSLNPKTRTTKMLSIPRDTYTMIAGQPTPDKINHSYAFGGVDLTIDTVQNYLDVPIDYYAVVNMEGLIQVIDAIGGIEVTSPLTFTYRGTTFKKGETREVNGVKAMNFARMRYDDPEGEVGRQNRQKMVIKAVIDKIIGLDIVTTYPKLLEVAKDNVKTNFDLSTALSIYQKYLPALDNLISIKFENLEDLYINEVFYFYIPMSSRLKVANELRQQLAMPPIGLNDLVDPMSDNAGVQVAKTSTLILNQYPSGVSQAQLEQILRSQESIQTIRETEYYVPDTSYYYIPPTYTPVAPTTPPDTSSGNDSSETNPETGEVTDPVLPGTDDNGTGDSGDSDSNGLPNEDGNIDQPEPPMNDNSGE